MKIYFISQQFMLTAFLLGASLGVFAQTKYVPEDTEFYNPKPPVVRISQHVPSDAIVLFDGSNLDKWTSVKKQGDADWTVRDGVLEVKPGHGDIRTKDLFEDFQLHVEWRSPELIKGKGQGRGNSGIFLQGLYEVQVLDNDDNPTYVNGQAGSIYKQQPPLKEVRKKEDGWHYYDIIYKAPRFNADGFLVSQGVVTVLHNGVVVQNGTLLRGTTEYIGMPKVEAHGPGPIQLQDHGDLVQFRNLWIRSL